MMALAARIFFAPQPCDECHQVRPLAELRPVLDDKTRTLTGWVCNGECGDE